MYRTAISVVLLFVISPVWATTYPLPASYYWRPSAGNFPQLPSHWYLGPPQQRNTSLFQRYQQPSPVTISELDGTRGAGFAGAAAGYDMTSKANEDKFTDTSIDVACTLAEIPQVDGCGYQRFLFCVVIRNTSAGHYYGFHYLVNHGRNGYVSFATIQSNGANDTAVFWDSVNGIGFSTAPMTGWTGAWANNFALRFPAQIALDSLLDNTNGLLLASCADSAANAYGRVVDICGTPAEAKIRAELEKLRSSVTTKQDMKDHIARCAGQDIEAGGSESETVDHTLDDLPSAGSAVDADSDGVADYLDIYPTDGTRSGPRTTVQAQNDFNAYVEYFSFWDLGYAGMNQSTFQTISIPWNRPVVGGPSVLLGTTAINTNMVGSVTGCGDAMETYRYLCRTLGVLVVCFYGMHAALITVRQW